MNHKMLVSVVSGVIAAVLVVGASTELLSPVSAAQEDVAVSEEQAVPEALAVAAEAVACERAIMADDVRSIADAEAAAVAAEQAQLRDQFGPVTPVDELRALHEQMREEAAAKVWHCPLTRDTYVSSPYGMRLHPVYGYYKMHNGVDLNSDYGDHIVAARAGVVIKAKYSSSGGYYVEVDHGDGFVTQYMHMSKYIVKVGQEVAAGELLGYVGNTGVSTSAHLHFGMLYNGSHVDPEDYMEF